MNGQIMEKEISLNPNKSLMKIEPGIEMEAHHIQTNVLLDLMVAGMKTFNNQISQGLTNTNYNRKQKFLHSRYYKTVTFKTIQERNNLLMIKIIIITEVEEALRRQAVMKRNVKIIVQHILDQEQNKR